MWPVLRENMLKVIFLAADDQQKLHRQEPQSTESLLKSPTSNFQGVPDSEKGPGNLSPKSDGWMQEEMDSGITPRALCLPEPAVKQLERITE